MIWAARMDILTQKGVLKRDICKQKDRAYACRHTWREVFAQKDAKMQHRTADNNKFRIYLSYDARHLEKK